MPRNYTRKTDNASYPAEKLLEAVRVVKSGTMSGYEAAKHYGIPRSTIINRVYDRKGLKSNTLGRATVLPRELEEDFVKNLHVMEMHGFGLTRKEILEMVGQYVSANAIKTPFKNGVPGADWFISFKKRYNLSIKKPQQVEYARKQACSPHIIYPYFDLLDKMVNELDLSDKPSHIWNVDETSFSKDPSKSKVVGYKGFTSTRTIASPGKDNTTVLLGCNALGEKTPPMIVYKGKHVWDEWTTDEGYPGTAYAATSNGWMETAVFEAFFEKVFLTTVGQKRPILLVYDGHSTHVGVNLIKKAREANITILKIPPHTSHLLQPLDLSVNKSFKDRWDSALVKWQRMNIGKPLPKKDFAKMLGQIWDELDPAICAAGFRKAGIYPLNKNAISEDKFNQILLREWKLKSTSNETDFVEDPTKQPFSDVQLCDQYQISVNTNLQEPRAGTSKQTDPMINEKSSEPESLLTLSLKSINSMDLTLNARTFHMSHLKNDCISLSNQLNAESVGSNTINISNQTSNKSRNSMDLTLNARTFHMSQHSQNDCVSLSNQLNAESVDYNTINISNQTSKIKILENRTVTFEDLLLMRIKAGTSSKTKRKRMATGAEVITRDDVYKRTLEAQISEVKKKEKKSKTNAKAVLTKQQDNIIKATTKKIKDPGHKVKQNSKTKKKENKTLAKCRKKQNYSTTSSESEMEIKYDEDSDDNDFWSNVLRESNDEDGEAKLNYADKENFDTALVSKFFENDWVLVKFCTKKSVKHYVGVVLSINDAGSPVVKYTRKKSKAEGETIFTFPVLEDISEVNRRYRRKIT